MNHREVKTQEANLNKLQEMETVAFHQNFFPGVDAKRPDFHKINPQIN